MKLPYIICEVGLNHGGDYDTAVNMVRAAADAGANAVKFQYVKADRLVARNAPTYFRQTGDEATTQHEFFRRSDALDRADYERLKLACDAAGVDFLCTVFDVESVRWIAPLVPAFKVASADITNVPLLEAIRQHAPEPIYISTGATSREEIKQAWSFFQRTPNVTWLHCVLAYPTATEHAALGAMQELPGPYGYSDHTLFNLDVLTTAWLLGATVIEKHFTLDKSRPGNDHYHSMDPKDLRSLISKLKELQMIIGDGEKRILPIEEPARLQARQSLHAAAVIPAGARITASDVIIKRPSDGLSVEMLSFVVGSRSTRVLVPDDPITADAISNLP